MQKQNNALKRISKSVGRSMSSASASLIAILAGLVAGFGILLISNSNNALEGLLIILKGGLNNGMKGVGQVLYTATPLILTGLSVGFAFKTGMFNIGATGQLMVGGLASIYIGVTCTFLPGPLHWIVALLGGMLAGALWGGIVGVLRAMLNVHEVISSIMLNYIGLYGMNYLIKNSVIYDQLKNESASVAANAALPKGGLDSIFYNLKGKYMDVSSVNAGIYIALGLAIAVYIVLNRTTFGYELKTCGANRYASRYAGINEKRSIALSMVIAGALAGAAGATMYLAPATGMHVNVVDVMPSQGFDGIAVALLGMSNPIGIIFSGLFIAHISVGGGYLQSLKYMREVIDIIVALIIYFSAFSLLVRNIMARAASKRRRRAEAQHKDGEEAA